MMWNLLRSTLRWLMVPTIALLVLAIPRWWINWHFADRIHTLNALPDGHWDVAIVFGAGLRWDSEPTAVLADRVATAVRLREMGRVDRLMMSGTERGGYDEPAAMARLASSLGVPADAILLDGQGTRTIETCRRARSEIGLQRALLVSQTYHLPRALAICSAFGMDVDAVSADLRPYRAERLWTLREIPATWAALLEAHFGPQPSAPAKPAIPILEGDHGP
ncbi:MAG: ElyC/SanA/YdcF family protein [Anaerolineales bacterium]